MRHRRARTPRRNAIIRLLGALALLAALLTGAFLSPARAASLTVTNTNDSGPGTLRQAIASAAPSDTVTFDASLSGQTIALTSTLNLSKSVTIDGSGLDTPVTLSGNNAVQVFRVLAGITVGLDSLTISTSSNDRGGAIDNSGTLVVEDCIIEDNHGTWGGAIVNWGTLTIDGSTFAGNNATWGGAIYNQGTLTVRQSTFSGNSTGAVSNHGTATVEHSLFSGNSGGAVSNYGAMTVQHSLFTGNSGGSAIYNWELSSSTGTLTVTNSTFTGNQGSSKGGAVQSTGVLTLVNNTFSGNSASFAGGSLYIAGGTMNYSNTIIADSSRDIACWVDPELATIATNVKNLVEDGSCEAEFSGDPGLLPLADNGGPTPTHALPASSLAIDAGDLTVCPATDQRGVRRPLGAGCDLGAYEYPVPYVRTDPAGAVGTRTATLNATAGASGLPTTVAFEWGPTATYGTTAPALPGSLTGLADTAVSHALSGLTPNTTYHYRVVASNSAGTSQGQGLTFTTQADPPTATTGTADDVTARTATLHGVVYPGYASTTVTFEYGLTDTNGQSVAASESPLTGSADTAVSQTLAGLSPKTTYHYRVVAENSAGTAYGEDKTFTTPIAPPEVTTVAAGEVTPTGATLQGLVNPGNDSTTVTFEWGETAAYGQSVEVAESPLTGVADTAVSYPLSGLTPNTTYHYRVVATNSAGTSQGEDRTFTTSLYRTYLPLVTR